jgi:ABC-2 type transport system ATP-binding protein
MNNIEIKGVTKQYRNNGKGLDDVTFSIGSGVFGLLGHNGAGKTTLMKTIATILRPTSGTVAVMGHDTVREGDAVRRSIGYLPQELSMYPSLTVYDFVCYMAGLKGIREKSRIQKVLEQVDLQDFLRRRIGQLSGGMRRRVGIAQALVGDPQILIVDEPTAGLDPEERVRFRGVLSRFAKDGRTVLLSTHLVEDVYQLSERLAVLREGKLFFTGTSQELLRSVHGKIKVLNLNGEQELLELRKKAAVISTTYEGDRIKARFMDENNAFPVSPVAETLEDAYVSCMGGKARE